MILLISRPLFKAIEGNDILAMDRFKMSSDRIDLGWIRANQLDDIAFITRPSRGEF
jgi:hypothetical protein